MFNRTIFRGAAILIAILSHATIDAVKFYENKAVPGVCPQVEVNFSVGRPPFAPAHNDGATLHGRSYGGTAAQDIGLQRYYQCMWTSTC